MPGAGGRPKAGVAGIGEQRPRRDWWGRVQADVGPVGKTGKDREAQLVSQERLFCCKSNLRELWNSHNW